MTENEMFYYNKNKSNSNKQFDVILNIYDYLNKSGNNDF